MAKRSPQPLPTNVPAYCDFICPHAEFPPPDTSGLCRTMSAVWCGQLKSLVRKNARCAWRREIEPARPRSGERSKASRE